MHCIHSEISKYRLGWRKWHCEYQPMISAPMMSFLVPQRHSHLSELSDLSESILPPEAKSVPKARICSCRCCPSGNPLGCDGGFGRQSDKDYWKRQSGTVTAIMRYKAFRSLQRSVTLPRCEQAVERTAAEWSCAMHTRKSMSIWWKVTFSKSNIPARTASPSLRIKDLKVHKEVPKFSFLVPVSVYFVEQNPLENAFRKGSKQIPKFCESAPFWSVVFCLWPDWADIATGTSRTDKELKHFMFATLSKISYRGNSFLSWALRNPLMCSKAGYWLETFWNSVYGSLAQCSCYPTRSCIIYIYPTLLLFWHAGNVLLWWHLATVDNMHLKSIVGRV